MSVVRTRLCVCSTNIAHDRTRDDDAAINEFYLRTECAIGPMSSFVYI